MIDDEMNNLKRQLKDTQKQIDEIQNDCKHPEIKLMLVPNGTFKVVKVCIVCDAQVGYPTNEERDEFLK